MCQKNVSNSGWAILAKVGEQSRGLRTTCDYDAKEEQMLINKKRDELKRNTDICIWEWIHQMQVFDTFQTGIWV